MSNDIVYQQLTLQFQSISPGQMVAVQLVPNGASIEFSSGPALADSAGVQVVAQSGFLPLAQLTITSSHLAILTQSGSANVTGFTMTLFLAADPSVSTFSMRSTSDAGILVMAQIGDSNPQAIGGADTVFSWHPH
jgi:hypothetical protein